MIRWPGLLALLSLSALARAEDPAPLGQLPDTVVPTHYRLSLSIDPRQKGFSGEAVIEVEIRVPLSTIWLHGLGLKVQSATISSGGHTAPARYAEIDHETGVARLVSAAALAPGHAVLRLRYAGAFQSSPQGLYRTSADKRWYVFSQMEAIDARRVFPGFDEPRFKTPYDITIETHGADLAVSNAPQLSVARTAHGATYQYQTTRPLPTYLIAFAVGPLQIVPAAPVPANAVRHEPLPLRIIGTQGDAARFSFAAAQAPELISRLEAYFGSAFPYPKIDLIASPIHLGAMENAGAIIFEEALLAFAAAAHAAPAGRLRHGRRARARAPVVRRPGDAGVVGRYLAERVLCRVDGQQDRRPVAAQARPGTGTARFDAGGHGYRRLARRTSDSSADHDATYRSPPPSTASPMTRARASSAWSSPTSARSASGAACDCT